MLVFDCVMYTVYYNATMIRVHGTSKNSLTPVADALFCCCCVLAVLVCRRADLSIAQYVGRGTDMYYVLCMRRNKTMPMPMRNAYRWHTICILYMYKHIESEPHIVYTIFVVLYSRQTIFGVIYEAKPFRTLGMFCRTNFWRKKKRKYASSALDQNNSVEWKVLYGSAETFPSYSLPWTMCALHGALDIVDRVFTTIFHLQSMGIIESKLCSKSVDWP